MWKLIQEYLGTFGKDFPFSDVVQLTEYEVVRIMQDCLKTGIAYTPTRSALGVIGLGKIGEAKINAKEEE